MRRRMDGFSDDGLSYSVAADFDKQLGQAMAEQEARLKDQRYIPGALVERPDAPDVLQRELIDPVLTGFGFNRPQRMVAGAATRQPAVRTYEMGNELIQIDPVTGKAVPIYTQNKPAPELSPRQRLEYSDLLATRRALTTKDYLTTEDRARLADIEKRIMGFQPSGTSPGAGPVRPGQRGKLTPDLVKEYKARAKGDLEEAKRLAIEDGYDIYVD